MIKYAIDENGFLTGEWAIAGGFANQIELENELERIDLNLQWDGTHLIKRVNPKVEEKALQELRDLREKECFSIVNRGAAWYAMLSDVQKEELNAWYKEWLDITEKYQQGINIETIIPKKPNWLK